jgi:four helix bundle protein
MAKIESFEDMKVWQASRILNKMIFELIIDNNQIKDYPLKDQINRASGSIMDNIAEGFERQGNKEFRQFLTISRGSCGEVKSQLYRAFDRNYIDETTFNNLLIKAKEISKMLNGFIKYLNSSDYTGSKFLKEPTIIYGRNDY